MPRATKTAGLEFRVPCFLDQDGIAIVDAVALTPLAADLGRFDEYAVRQRRHPFLWQAGRGTQTQLRNLDANSLHRRSTPGSRCKPLDVSGRACR